MTAEKAERKLAAVLHADVKGYSRLMHEDEEATVRALSAHKGEMARLIAVHRGRVVDTAGDGFLLEFASVVDAVGFAIEFQEEIRDRNTDVPENRRMEFRIGINVGDVIAEDDKIYGDGVNIAARLEGLAEPGGICISGTAHDQVKEKLALDYEFLGDQRVKNIAEPVRAYRIRREQEDSYAKEASARRIRARAWGKGALAAFLILVVLAGAATLWHTFIRTVPKPKPDASQETPALALPDKPSIAVLPFNNMSRDPKQEYFSDGITEEIITGLSKIPQLFVIARQSSFSFKGKNVTVQEVARKLGVRYVLEGSVRKEGERVRITAQLIDAQTGGHVWAERYDRELKDIFALQDEIALKVMIAMQVQLSEGQQIHHWTQKMRMPNREDRAAFEKVLRARWLYSQGTEEANYSARKLLKEVVASEPALAGLYAMLAGTYIIEVLMGWGPDMGESARKAYINAEKALSLDDSLDGPHYAMAVILAMSRRCEEAVVEAERAVDLNPNGSEAHAALALVLNWAGRPVEAIPVIQKALRLNPFPPGRYYGVLGMAFRMTGQYDKAIRAYTKGLRRQHNSAFILNGLAATYSLAGRTEEARKIAKRFLKLNPKFSLKRYEEVIPHKDKAERKKYIDALRSAGLN